MVRPESKSRPAAWQPDAQPTEPPVRGSSLIASSYTLLKAIAATYSAWTLTLFTSFLVVSTCSSWAILAPNSASLDLAWNAFPFDEVVDGFEIFQLLDLTLDLMLDLFSFFLH